jgi:hypothetical protein
MITAILAIVTLAAIVFTIISAITAANKNKKYKATIGSLTDGKAEDSSASRSIKNSVNSAEDVLIFSSLGTTVLIVATAFSACNGLI